jgi:ATP-dependent DNA helicase RecG
MMNFDVEQIVRMLRRDGDDGQRIEAKSAAGGVPEDIANSLCAFANTGGGIVILGVDQSRDFGIVGVRDPGGIVRSIKDIARDALVPALSPTIEAVDVGDRTVVVCDVAPVGRDQQPVEVRRVGSFIRTGDGNVRLTGVQVQAMVARRTQPRFDMEPVDGATVDDLDAAAMGRYIAKLRSEKPSVFGTMSDTELLLRTNVLARVEETNTNVPTIAGLLALGIYPQQYFPQLNASIVVFGTTTGDPIGGRRYLDNVRVDGPIGAMLVEAQRHLLRHFKSRAIFDAEGHRRNESEYPAEALRELLANAFVHRDLSPVARGSQVAVELYPDRLVIENPGGLYGTVTIESLGDPGRSSSRNAALARILEDTLADDGTLVIENRANGIFRARRQLREAGIEPPLFEDEISHFRATVHPSALLDPGVRQWLEVIGAEGVRPSLQLALVQMRRGIRVTNETYRQAIGVDSTQARADLRILIDAGLARMTGLKRWAHYELGARADAANARLPSERHAEVLRSIRGETSRAEIELRTGFPKASVVVLLNELIDLGVVAATAPPKSKRRRYVKIAPDPSTLF